jgi:glycosyltransferase involved in cell wall biosynthesis
MKILFIFGALTHYFNYVLNSLNSKEFDITALIASNDSAIIGKGVNKSKQAINFNLVELPEYKTWYGKYFFRGFKQLLIDKKIEVIVVGWPYILAFVFNPFLYHFCKRNTIKIVFREIPFQLPKKQDAYKYNSTATPYTENCDAAAPSAGILTYIKTIVLTTMRQAYYKKASAFLTYTESAWEILPTYGVNKNKITVYYNSPDTNELAKTYTTVLSQAPILPPNPYRIIHVGRLVKWKRVDLLIEAVALLKKEYPTIELLVLGGGPETETLKALAQQLNCSNNVKFIGAVYDPIVLGHYFHEATVYVLAGMGGLSINEAMAFAKPIIVSVCDGTEKHLVKNNFNGYYFTENDATDLAAKMKLLLDNPTNVKLFGERSLSIIRDDINSEKVLNAFKQCFNSLK